MATSTAKPDEEKVEGEEKATPMPSLVTVVNRNIVAGVNVAPVDEDGGRVLSVYCPNGTVIELAMTADVVAHVQGALNGDGAEPTPEIELAS